MQETQGAWVLFLGQEMATCSSILAQKTPWTEEPGGLYSPWGLKQLDTTGHTHIHLSYTIYIGVKILL